MAKPLRVLIVEDAENDVLLLLRQLRRDGFDPVYERVETRAELAAALDREPWDIVISDYVLPTFSAPDVLALLKERGSDLPVIILSGAIGEETAVEAMRAGASDFLVKSNLTRLCPAIEREMAESVNRRERRRAEEERARLLEQLQAEQARLEAVLQKMPAGVILAEAPSGRLVFGNEQTERIWRHPFRPAADVSDYKQYVGFHPDGRPMAPDEWPLARAIRRGETVTNEEIDILRGDGTRGTIAASAAPIREGRGRIVAAVVTFADLTERKRAEQAQRFLAEASAILSGSLDEEATLASVAKLAVPALADWCVVDMVQESGAIRRMAIEHPDPVRMRMVAETGVGLPRDPSVDAGMSYLQRAARPRLFPEVTDAVIDRIAGDPAHAALLRDLGLVSGIVAPLIARDRMMGAISLFTAESGRRYGAEDLALVQDLAQRAAIAVDNARLYRQAQEAVRIRDDFLSSVSHDLKTPLTTIKGLAQLAMRWAGRTPPDSGRVVETIKNIDTAATRMTALIGELLDVVRLQVGRPLELNRAPVDLAALACELVREQQQTATRHEFRLEKGAPEVMGEWDGPRLGRVLANLLSNAVKYSPNGGVITVSVAPTRRDGRDLALLRVQDEGVGIPSGDLPHIFERFHRGRNVTGRIEGSGIGLAGVRQIVEQHGGTISVESREGAGTTVTVLLSRGEAT